ncbi:MAG: GAF domain-containing protein [Deltaproteobacteria bacterium]|nr:MAG: GAF domain-containing protein [Deltaproteobacteria bacterium]
MGYSSERRRSYRFQSNMPIFVRVGENLLEALVVDFAETGWGLQCKEPLSEQIEILIPDVRLQAQVIWRKKDEDLYQVGVRFCEDYSSKAARHISTQVRACSRRETHLTKIIRAIEVTFENLDRLNLNDVFDVITRYAAEIAEAEVSALFMSKCPGYLTLVANFGSPDGSFDIGEEIQIEGRGLTKFAAREKRPLILKGEQIANHAYLNKDKSYDYLLSKQLYSLIYNPLLGSDGSLLGILKVENKRSPEGFDEVDKDILDVFSRIIITSIETATSIAELKALYEIDRALSSSLQLKQVLNKVLEFALQITEADWAHIRLFDEKTNSLNMVTGWGRTSGDQHPYIDYAPKSKKPGADVSGKVFASGEAEIIKDVSEAPHFQQMLQVYKEKKANEPNFDKDNKYEQYLGSIKSEMVVPLKLINGTKARVIGTATVQSSKLSFFTPRKLGLFDKFALHAAIAIKNARLMAEHEEMVSKFNALFRVTESLTGQFNVDEACQTVAKAVTDALYYKTCMVWVRNEKGYLVPRSWTGNKPPHQFAIGNKEYAAGVVSATGERLIIDDVRDSLYKFPPHLLDSGTFISLPLKIKQETFGVLDAFVGTVRNLPEGEIKLMETFATQVATLIWNIETYGKIISLGHIAEAIEKAGNLDTALKLILTGITAKEGLSFNRAAIFRYDPERNTLKGWLAIGHIGEREGRQVWEQMKEQNVTFNDIIGNMLEAKHQFEPLEQAIKGLEITLDGGNPFAQALNSHRCQIIQKPDDFPASVLETLAPASECLLMPLISHETGATEKMGVIFVDNKFDGRPMETNKIEALKAYANFIVATYVRRLRSEGMERTLNIVAHQLVSPVAAIAQDAELLAEREPALAKNRFFDGIRTSAWKIDQIVRKLMAMAKIQTGAGKCDRRCIFVKDLLDRVIERIPILSRGRVRIDAKDPISITVDADLIEMAILNIIDNGLKYSSNDVIVKTWAEDEDVFVSIRDFGIGISEDKDELFKPRFEGGLSLGLWIAKYYIDFHQGKIWYESEAGKGTKFIVVLPKAEEVQYGESSAV